MKKLFRIFIVFLVLLSIHVSAYAVDIDMNISNDTTNSAIVNDDDENTVNNVIPGSSSTAKVSTSQTSEDFTLSVSDIINIILISVGIVLIFLAIAILIKIK